MNFLKFEFTFHSLVRANERNITIDQIKEVVESGEIIAEYSADKPFKSFLSMKFFDNEPLHVCFAVVDENTCRVITVYKPDLNIFEEDFKTRRK